MSAPNPDAIRRALLRELILRDGAMRTPPVPSAAFTAVVDGLVRDRRVVVEGGGLVMNMPPSVMAATDDGNDRHDAATMMQLLLHELERRDGSVGEYDDRRPRSWMLYTIARDALVADGLVEVRGEMLHDASGDLYRAPKRAAFTPVWQGPSKDQKAASAPTLVAKVAPAPAPTPAISVMPEVATPAASEPKPKPAELVDMPAAPKAAPTVAKEELVTVAPKPAAPAVTVAKVEEPKPEPAAPTPVVVTAPEPRPDPAGMVIADELRQLNGWLAALAGQGRFNQPTEAQEERARIVLARRIAVLLTAHGPLTRSDLTRKKLSNAQVESVRDALDYGSALGAFRMGSGRRYALIDYRLLGLTQEVLESEIELIRQRAEARAAREANAEIAAETAGIVGTGRDAACGDQRRRLTS